jgi:hypothetical protein
MNKVLGLEDWVVVDLETEEEEEGDWAVVDLEMEEEEEGDWAVVDLETEEEVKVIIRR